MPHNRGGVFSPSTEQGCLDILDPDIPDALRPNKERVLEHFDIHKMEDVSVKVGNKEYKLQVRIFADKEQEEHTHTCLRLGGNAETLNTSSAAVYPLLESYVKERGENASCPGLQLFQLSLYGHSVKEEDSSEWKPWKPSEAKEIGAVFFELLNHLKKMTSSQTTFDSMICNSFSSVIFEALQEIDSEILPKTLILDRALTSVWKVGEKLRGTTAAYVLCGGAYVAGWYADPEKQLVNLFSKMNSTEPESLKDREIIVIEVEDDFYFSGIGSFSPNFPSELNIAAFRHSFSPCQATFHRRSHHALPLDKVTNGPEAIDNPVLRLEPYQSVSDALMHKLLFKR